MPKETDYTGCNTEINRSLMSGQHRKVITSTENGTKGGDDTIISYVAERELPYIGLIRNYNNDEIVPAPLTETRVIGYEAMMVAIRKLGYVPVDNFIWESVTATGAPSFLNSYWKLCGTKVCDTKEWPAWALEEVEV